VYPYPPTTREPSQAHKSDRTANETFSKGLSHADFFRPSRKGKRATSAENTAIKRNTYAVKPKARISRHVGHVSTQFTSIPQMASIILLPPFHLYDILVRKGMFADLFDGLAYAGAPLEGLVSSLS